MAWVRRSPSCSTCAPTASSAAASSAGTLGTFFYARDIEPGWVDVNPVSLPLPRLPGAFDGYRIVHITDLHADATFFHSSAPCHLLPAN